MYIQMLKSKIHRAVVTGADLEYVGSITLDPELIEKANLKEWEKVLICNINTGDRFETYIIQGTKGKKEVILNGAAARKVQKGDLIIIMSFCFLEESEADKFTPCVIQMDKDNQPISSN